jgi:hypothetical protein
MESTMPANFGEFLWAVVIVLGLGALLYFGGSFLLGFFDSNWRKKYWPLIKFLSVTASVSGSVLHVMQRAGASNRAFGLGFFVWLGFMASCIRAWRRYLITHPDGPPEAPPPVSDPDSAEARK